MVVEVVGRGKPSRRGEVARPLGQGVISPGGRHIIDP